MNFEELSTNQLWLLRKDIVISSDKEEDYDNIFGFTPSAVKEFFQEYLLFINDIIEEEYGSTYKFGSDEWWIAFEDLDTPSNLREHYDSYYDFYWMEKFI